MQLTELLDRLGYTASPNFLRPSSENSLERAADFSHVFRRAQEHCNLRGVYSLRHPEQVGRDTIVPVVYVCEADDEDEGEVIHRKVWNQNVVPFLIVAAPRTIRLYSGFHYDRPRPDSDPKLTGLLQAAHDMNQALGVLELFRAEQIDNGTIWDKWGAKVTPETKVDWRLLRSLDDLDAWLQKNGIEDPEVSHALIGKYVYLHYLRERGILSDRRLAEWDLSADAVFGRGAQVSAFWKVVDKLDERLNGSVFPLNATGRQAPRQEHVRMVAKTFKGDDPTSGQFALDFGLFDFSFIPIETLSVIYEQFLHSPKPGGGTSRGKAEGAYYTPLPLVNFMLEELDSLCPFQEGMRVLDPACGSGAFLVQCYRRIIEQDGEFKPGKPMRPARLRELLERHVFGIDRDADACRVAELSLSLTLLDYVHPPDLKGFRLPDLHGSNIHHGDFFETRADWVDRLQGKPFDWVVGNPPWIEINPKLLSREDQRQNRLVWKWMQDHNRPDSFPTGGNQVAEAFAWKVTEHVTDDGCVALLLPAMTLFKDESETFRKGFFGTLRVHSVANFANLAYVLFPGHRQRPGGKERASRPQQPAVAFFYTAGRPHDQNGRIAVFSPFVAEQPANRPETPRRRKDTWNIVIDGSQLRRLDVGDVGDGGMLPWKTAMWGSHLDLRLLKSVASRFQSFGVYYEANSLRVAEGFQLRAGDSKEPIEPMPELAGKLALRMKGLRRCGLVFEFPPHALERIPAERANLRVRGGKAGLEVSKPPHVLVDVARRFAVYSDEFIAVPPRQIGISGLDDSSAILKALSLFLVSDFAIYHQFLTAPQWGVSKSIATLRSLHELPVPFSKMSEGEITHWAHLHGQIVEAARARDGEGPLFDHKHTQPAKPLKSLLEELNDRVFRALRLRNGDRALVRDLLHVRMELIKGKVSKSAIRPASDAEIGRYARVLTDELDAFVDDQPSLKHSTVVLHNGRSAIVRARLHRGSPPRERIRIEKADSVAGKEFASIRSRVRQENSQWVYFERNLRLYEGRDTYIFKPLERLYWTESQAILDAGTIIAETLS